MTRLCGSDFRIPNSELRFRLQPPRVAQSCKCETPGNNIGPLGVVVLTPTTIRPASEEHPVNRNDLDNRGLDRRASSGWSQAARPRPGSRCRHRRAAADRPLEEGDRARSRRPRPHARPGADRHAGRAPNFKKLAEMGSFKKLATTMPALSPVAWSSFITGMTPGSHGIADFITRDPGNLPAGVLDLREP